MIRTDRMKRHQRGTKPLRGQARDVARNRLFVGAPPPNWRDSLDGTAPWPKHIQPTLEASWKGGAR